MRYLAQGSAALVVLVGSVGVAYADKSVDLSLDGKQSSVHVFGSTVADVLDKEGITVGEHDVVVPGLATKVSDGDDVSVRFGRKLTVTVDGVTKEYWTTATTVDAALTDIGIRAEGAVLSASRSQALGRQGLAMSITLPKKVTLVADKKTRTVTSSSPTVAELLTELKVTLDKDDKISPAVTTPLTQGLKVVVQRITVKEVTATEAIAYSTTKQKDSSMYTDQSKTIKAGVNGSKTVVREKTYVDGKLSKTKVLKTTVTKQPVAAIVKVGTKARPVVSAGNTSGAGINLANAAMWDRIAQCESGGNWSINTGNGYYGGLQFSYSTWLGVGGADFAQRADLASRAEQITVANRLYARSGLSPWGCAHAA